MKTLYILFALFILCINSVQAQYWDKTGTNIFNNNAGNVGIGIFDPLNAQLEIAKNSGGTLAITTNGSAGSIASPIMPSVSFLGYLNGPKARIRALEQTYNGYGSNLIFSVKDNVDATTMLDVMTLKYNGNVGVNNSNPAHALDVNGNIYTNSKLLIGTSGLNSGSHSLAVNGSAIFTKVVVKLNNVWPDYVFKHNYNLRPLNELESFLIKYQHLPDMPSSAEVEKNGLDLGEHQSLLLKKVEELTLYVIELNKKVVALSLENAELKKK